MSFLARIGKVANKVGRTIGDVGNAVKTIANNAAVRTISTALGTAGRIAMPLVSAAAPELAPVVGAVAKGLQTGSILNKISNSAGIAANVGQAVSKVGATLK
jgi:Na+/H+ antiporter NhaC